MFRFKLEFLLRYRKQIEETAMHELAERIREANRIEADLAEARARRTKLYEETNREAADGIDGATFNLYKGYQEHLLRRGKMLEKGLVRAEQRIDQQRDILVKASVDRKIIERYREKRLEAHVKEEERRENMNLDELASLARSRKPDEKS